MQHFQLVLKNEKRRYYSQLTWFVIVLNILGFIYITFFSSSVIQQYKGLVSAVLASFVAIYKLIFWKEEKPARLWIFFLLSIICWTVINLYWVAVLMLLFGLLYLRVQMSFTVIFTRENIIYPSFPIKKITWDELTNVILKDDLLTIDFKNNKLIQQAVDESVSSVNEEEFNEFCRMQLKMED